MTYCGECGTQITSEAMRFCPSCGSRTAVGQDPSVLPGAHTPIAEPSGGSQQPAAVLADPPRNGEGRRRWTIPVAVAGVAVVVIGVGSAVALRVLGGVDPAEGAWMWRQAIDSSQSNYGMALREGDGFVQGPPVGVGSPASFLLPDGRTVAMPEFADGYASLVRRSDGGDGTVTLSIVAEDGAQVVSEWAGDLAYLGFNGANWAQAYIDASATSVFFTIDRSDVGTCYRVDAKELKAIQVASASNCRWDGDRAVAVSQPEGSAPRFTVHDRNGAIVAEGQFPAGEYGSANWSSADGWIWATRTVSSDVGAQRSTLEVLDLTTGQPVATQEGFDTSILATADGGRGLVVAVDGHEERWDVVLLDRDGTASAAVEVPKYASALISEDGRRAWIGTHGEDRATLHVVGAGSEPSLALEESAIRLLSADSGDALVAVWGADTTAYDVVKVDPSGAKDVVLSGQQAGVDTTAGWRVSAMTFAGRQLVLGPDGAAGSLWELTAGDPVQLLSGLDLPEEGGEGRAPQFLSGPSGELLVLYSQAGQDKLDLIRAADVTPLTQGPSIEVLGIDDGQAWYSALSEGEPTASYSVGLDGKDLPKQADILLGATPAAVRSDVLYSSSAYWSDEPWMDPVRTDCVDSGYEILRPGESYESMARDIYVCAELGAGDRISVSPAVGMADHFIIAADSVGSDSVEGLDWTAPRAGTYKINFFWNCWNLVCSDTVAATTINAVKGSSA